jgi:MFS transporter, ACS family, glucarate transporter
VKRLDSALAAERETHIRYLIVAMLFVASSFSYGDRVALSVGGVAMQKALGLSAGKMGILLAAGGWSYVCGQLPSGGLLDRFGSKRVYGVSIVAWSVSAAFIALAGYAPAAWVFTAIFALRLVSGLAQSPVFPGNGRIVAAWFPTAERGRASAIFNASQYFALFAFGRLFGWLAQNHGWQSCFWFMAAAGLVLALVWWKTVYSVPDHPLISRQEIDCIEQGGGLVQMDRGKFTRRNPLTWATFTMLVRQRMLVGIYIGQFCINTLTTFFLTWFPFYLVQVRHMSIFQAGAAAGLPALFGCIGGILGGVCSDWLLKRGHSLTFARKAPIVAGMLLAVTIIGCNYTDKQSAVMALMTLAFFGKGFGALGWTVIADTSPKELVGVNGGVFNLFGNISTVTTPMVIGFLKQRTGSFNEALVFVGVTALVAIFSYLVIVPDIKRLELKPQEAAA